MRQRNCIAAAFVLLVAGAGRVLGDAPAAAPAGAASKVVTRTIALPGRRGLVMAVPEGWGFAARSPRPGMPPSVRFGGGAGDDRKFSVQLTVMAVKDKAMATPDKLRELARGRGEAMLADSKETKLELADVTGREVAGAAFTLTDKAPDPGSFENMTSVFALASGEFVMGATVLHHAKDSPERQQAIEMLRSAQVTLAPKAGADGGLRADAPAGGWSLVVPGSGLEVVQQSYDPARKVTQVMAANAQSGLVVSVFMEPAPKAGDAAVVRNAYWGRAKDSPLKKEGITLGKPGEVATVEYTVPEAGGRRVNQRNLNVYTVHDGVWADVHVSKTDYAEADKAVFDRVAGGVTFDPPAGKGK